MHSYSSNKRNTKITNNYYINEQVRIYMMCISRNILIKYICISLLTLLSTWNANADVCKNETCYYYGDSGLLFINDVLYSAIIKNNLIAVLSEIIPGGIRVGDNADETKNKLSHYTDDTIVDVGNGFRVGGNDDWILFDTKKGVITEIFYCLETP